MKSSVRAGRRKDRDKRFGRIISNPFRNLEWDAVAFGFICAASAYPHGTVKENKLKDGDIVLIDGGCTVGGKCIDITRTTVLQAERKNESVWNRLCGKRRKH